MIEDSAKRAVRGKSPSDGLSNAMEIVLQLHRTALVCCLGVCCCCVSLIMRARCHLRHRCTALCRQTATLSLCHSNGSYHVCLVRHHARAPVNIPRLRCRPEIDSLEARANWNCLVLARHCLREPLENLFSRIRADPIGVVVSSSRSTN